MEMRDIIALILLFVHLVIGTIAMIYFTIMSMRYKTPISHGLINLLAMLFLAISMSVFRLLQGINTRVLKYVHTGMHLGIWVLITGSLIPLLKEQGFGFKEWHYMHGTPAWALYACYILQIIMALVFFVLLFPDGPVRSYAASFHDIVGLWLYYCYVGVAISGWHNCRNSPANTGFEDELCISNLDIFKTLMICDAFFVHVVVLFPYFNWEMVGPL